MKKLIMLAFIGSFLTINNLDIYGATDYPGSVSGGAAGGSGGAAVTRYCDPGHFVKWIVGRGGNVVDKLKFICDDGTSLGEFGPSTGGQDETAPSDYGFDSLKVTSVKAMGIPKLVGQVVPNAKGGYGFQTTIGSGIGDNAETTTLSCPSGRIVGV